MRKYWLRALSLLVSLYLFAVMYRYFSYWGIGAALAIILFIALIVALAALISFLLSHKWQVYVVLRRFIVRVAATTFGRWLDRTVRRRFPRLHHWLRDTIDLTTAPGIALTVGVMISLIFLLLFLGTAFDALFNRDLALADVRLIFFFRTVVPEHARDFFIFFTHLADPLTILMVFGATAFYLLLLNQYRWIIYLALSLSGGYFASYLSKLVLGRLRPLGINLIDLPDGASFPSGHALIAVCVYGFIGYLLFRKFKRPAVRILIVVCFLAFIILIGLSRAYLGVHYPSDVVGGWYLGAALLSLIISFFEIEYRFHFPGLVRVKNFKYSKKFQFFYLASLLASVSLLITWQYLRTEVVHSQERVRSVATIEEFLTSAEKYSEDLLGRRTQPISLIVVGSADELLHIFEQAGWHRAVVPNITNFFRQISRVAKNTPYQEGPMTPGFYNSRTNFFGFQKPTSVNTARQRHHTRFWESGYRLGGKDIWVGTASLDDGIEIGSVIKFPTHGIDPHVDKEREFIFSDLLGTGLTANIAKLDLVGLVEGKNAAGDGFTTDGWAYILYLK